MSGCFFLKHGVYTMPVSANSMAANIIFLTPLHYF